MPIHTQSHQLCSKHSIMTKNEANEQAIDDLKSQEVPNIDATARKWNVVEFILRHWYKNESVFYFEVYFKSIILFTNIQKLIFIEYINKFSVCNMHLIFQMFENFVVEITRHFIEEQ